MNLLLAFCPVLVFSFSAYLVTANCSNETGICNCTQDLCGGPGENEWGWSSSNVACEEGKTTTYLELLEGGCIEGCYNTSICECTTHLCGHQWGWGGDAISGSCQLDKKTSESELWKGGCLQVAEVPFSDSFELFDILNNSDWWTVGTTDAGRVVVARGYQYSGNSSVLLDASEEDKSKTELTLTVNLTGYDSAGDNYSLILSFWWKRMNISCENRNSNGIYLSDDLRDSLHQIMFFPCADSSLYHFERIDLSEEISRQELQFTEHFQIVFQVQFGHHFPFDGMSLDDIEIDLEYRDADELKIRCLDSFTNNFANETDLISVEQKGLFFDITSSQRPITVTEFGFALSLESQDNQVELILMTTVNNGSHFGQETESQKWLLLYNQNVTVQPTGGSILTSISLIEAGGVYIDQGTSRGFYIYINSNNSDYLFLSSPTISLNSVGNASPDDLEDSGSGIDSDFLHSTRIQTSKITLSSGLFNGIVNSSAQSVEHWNGLVCFGLHAIRLPPLEPLHEEESTPEPISPTPFVTPAPNPIPDTSPEQNDVYPSEIAEQNRPLSTLAIVGIVIGAVVIIILVCSFCCKTRYGEHEYNDDIVLITK